MLLHTLILVVAIVICLHVYFRYSYSGRLIHKLNGPKGIFLFGNIFDIFISPGEYLFDLLLTGILLFYFVHLYTFPFRSYISILLIHTIKLWFELL